MEQIKPNKVENEMAYIVVYQRSNGSSAVESCYDLDSAVEAAERLRNADSVERPRIFETSEIRYDFQPYYRVKVIDPKTTETLGLAADEMEPAFSFGEVVEVDRADDLEYEEEPVFDEPPYDEPLFDEPPFEEAAVEDPDFARDDLADADTENAVPQELEGQGTIDDHVDEAVIDEPSTKNVADEVVDEGIAADDAQVDDVADEDAEGADSDAQYVADIDSAPEEIDAAAEVDAVDSAAEVDASGDIPAPEEMVAPGTDDLGTNDEVLDLTDGSADPEGVAEESEAKAKPGLFEKFVKSLEGGEQNAAEKGAATAAVGTDAVGDASDAVDDLGGSISPRRGLFGK